MNYPFKEGEHYFTIETNTIVESCWDAQSEELYKADKMYFKTMNEAIFYHQYRKTLSMLLHAVSVIELDCNTADGNEFLERFERFNPKPKLSLI
jgi:predicted metallo-beta-lactamase superfamily hydrolase